MPDEKTTELFTSADELKRWLHANHDRSAGIWLKIAKKNARITTPSYDEALDVALTYGWIDGQKRPFDDEVYLQGLTPRRARSPWSKRNVNKAEALIASALMQPSGLAEVERAKADGRWERAYAGSQTAEAPADFLSALECNPAASDFYKTVSAANRFAIYYRIQDAKLPATRERRIAKFVDMLSRRETLH